MPRAKTNILNAIGIAENKIAIAKKVVRKRNSFVVQRDKCVLAISKCNQQLTELLGIDVSKSIISVGGNGKKRGPKLGTKRIKQDTLINFIHKVMIRSKTCTVEEIGNKVKKAGYKTHQKNDQNFRSTLGAVLRADPEIKHGRKRGTWILKPAVSKREKVRKKKKKTTEKTTQAATKETVQETTEKTTQVA